MKKKTWIVIGVIAVGLVFAVPIGIGIGVSADILNDFTNSNDWIGFWGSYSGSVVGGIISGFITMYVLFKTLENNEQNRVKSEKVAFCDRLVERVTVMVEYIEDCLYKASDYLRARDDLDKKNTLIIFSEKLRHTRAIVSEIMIQVGIRKEDSQYCPEKAEELYYKLVEIYDLLDAYYISVMHVKDEKDNIIEDEKNTNEIMKEKIADLTNSIANDLNSYLKDLFLK